MLRRKQMLQGGSAKTGSAQQGWCQIHWLQSWHSSQVVPMPSNTPSIPAPVLLRRQERSHLGGLPSLQLQNRGNLQSASLSIPSSCYPGQTW